MRFVIDFTAGGNAANYIGEGWSALEPTGCWSLGEAATLRLPGLPHAAAAGFVLRYMPAIGPHGQQRLRILLNGSEIATACANIGGHHVVRRGFPATLLRSDANTLTFEFLDPVVPAEVDAMSTDTRLLAMFAETLTLEVELAPSRRRLVLLHGDAQAEALAAALGSFPPVAAAFELRCLKPETDLAGAVAGLAPTEADLLALVLEQVRSGAGPQASLPAHVRVLRFPHLALHALWPFIGQDVRTRPEPGWPQGRYPVPDSIAAALAPEAAGLDDAAAFAAYLARSMAELPDLDVALAEDETRWRVLEAYCDFHLAWFLAAELRRRRLFHAPDAPGGAVLHCLAEQVLAVLAPGLPERPAALLAGLAFHLDGWQGMAQCQVPVHPAVARALDLAWFDPDLLYRWGAHRWSFRDYTLAYLRWAPWCC